MKDPYVVCSALAMARGSTLCIEDGRDLLVYVWQGELWLTQERDGGHDRHLGAGASFRLDRDGLALAQATRRTTVTLTAAEPGPYARRIALARFGEAPVELYAAAKPRRFWVDWFAPHARPTTAAL